MSALASQLVAQSDAVKQLGSAFAHLLIRQLAKFTHGNHHVFLRSEVLHQEVKLKDETNEFVSLLRELIVGQVGYRFGFNRNTACVRSVQQTKDIEQ